MPLIRERKGRNSLVSLKKMVAVQRLTLEVWCNGYNGEALMNGRTLSLMNERT